MKYYRAWVGYDKFISIDETELKKVIDAKLQSAVVIVKYALIDGKSISLIEPDINMMCGWSPDKKPIGSGDWAYIAQYEGQLNEHVKLLEDIKQDLRSDETKKLG